MSKKPYQQQDEPKESMANDSTMAYESTIKGDVASYLPDDILIASVHYAEKEVEQGRTIPNSEICEHMSERLGWK